MAPRVACDSWFARSAGVGSQSVEFGATTHAELALASHIRAACAVVVFAVMLCDTHVAMCMGPPVAPRAGVRDSSSMEIDSPDALQALEVRGRRAGVQMLVNVGREARRTVD